MSEMFLKSIQKFCEERIEEINQAMSRTKEDGFPYIEKERRAYFDGERDACMYWGL